MAENDQQRWTLIPEQLQVPLDVQWDKEGDEWYQYLCEALRTLVPVGGFSLRSQQATDTLPLPHYVFDPGSGALRSRLILFPLQGGGIFVAVEGDGSPSDDRITPWVMAILIARDRLGQGHKAFAWSAAIGPAASSEAHNSALEEAAVVQGLFLRDGGVLMQESRPARPPNVHAWGIHQSWPIVVNGTNVGYNWHVASLTATHDLYRLCALLSVAWKQCWVLREGPRPDEWGTVVIPEQVPWQVSAFPRDDVPQRQPLRVPTWLASAWSALDRDSKLVDALAAYFEGLQPQEDHPSFALIASVASIEAIGARLYDLQRCDTCNSAVGSAERFRRALRLVRAEDDAKALSKAYSNRSKTAHAGRLYGSENVFGAFPVGRIFSPDPALDFTWHQTFGLRNANRDLLELAFAEGLPAKQPQIDRPPG